MQEPTAAVDRPQGDVVPFVEVANALLLLSFLFVLLHPSILNPFQLEPHTAWTIHCYAFAIPILVINGLARRTLWHPTPFDYFMWAYVGIVFATWPTSFDRHTTAFAILGLVAQLAVFGAVRVLAENRPALARVVVAALVVGIAMLEWTAADVHLRIGLSTRLVGIPPLDWNGREGLGLAAAIQCALLVGIWQRTRSYAVQVAAIVLILGVVVELLFLYSRLAWAAVVAVLIAAFFCSIRLGRFRRYVVGLTIIGAFVAVVGTPYMIHLAKVAAGLELGDPRAESGLSFRLAAWLDAPAVIRRHAFLGTGLGAFMAVRPTIILPRSKFLPPELPTALHPHNAYLQQMAEVGIVGGAAYVAMWATALWAGWRISSQEGPGLGINVSLFLALVAIAISNVGENMFEGTERQRLHSIAWIVAAFVIEEWNRGRMPRHQRAEHAA